MGVVIGLVMRRAIPLFRAMQTKLDRINQVMREALAGVRVIRAFVRTHHEEERFEAANRDLFDTSIRVNRLFAVTIPTMMAIFNLSTVAVMWFGAIRVDSGGMPIGNLTAFLAYLMQILMAVLMAVFMFILVPRAAVSAERIQEVLTIEPSIKDPLTPVAMPTVVAAHGNGTGPSTPDHRRHGRVPRRGVPLPRRRAAGAPRHLLHRPARPDDRHRRLAPAAARPRSSTSSRASTT